MSKTLEENLRQLREDCRTIVEPFLKVSKTKAGDPKSIDQIRSALEKWPSSTAIGKAAGELQDQLKRFLDVAQQAQADAFSQALSDYVRDAVGRDLGKRELNEGWRIGPFEFDLKRAESKVRVLYNGEVLLAWTKVAALADFRRLETTAIDKLKGSGPEDEQLPDLLWSAYETLRAQRRAQSKADPGLVPLVDLYPQLRRELVELDLSFGRPDCELRFPRFPRWAFLYCLDRYRAMRAAIPAGKRLSLETGSQRESGRIGMRLNGLDARSSYETYCYVRATDAG